MEKIEQGLFCIIQDAFISLQKYLKQRQPENLRAQKKDTHIMVTDKRNWGYEERLQARGDMLQKKKTKLRLSSYAGHH